jgi:hypothetical protein
MDLRKSSSSIVIFTEKDLKKHLNQFVTPVTWMMSQILDQKKNEP